MKKLAAISFLSFSMLLSSTAQELAKSEKNGTSVVKFNDTITINERYRLVIPLPAKSVKSRNSYQAGYFISYFIPADTAIFSIYTGPLPEEPFVSGSGCMVTDSVTVEDVFFERRGYCTSCGEKITNRKGYFREKEYMLLLYSAKYEWVNEQKVELYDNIFSNIEILER